VILWKRAVFTCQAVTDWICCLHAVAVEGRIVETRG
jgi:hypothetical protein